jgi:hypothetical protein
MWGPQHLTTYGPAWPATGIALLLLTLLNQQVEVKWGHDWYGHQQDPAATSCDEQITS